MLSPLTREVLVDAEPSLAFEVFTDRIGQWWPVSSLSVYGAGASVALTDGVIVETGPAGEQAVWGTVTRWDPPAGLDFTWHPGNPADRASAVAVTFTAAGDQTLVRLEHSGWDVFADPDASRASYGNGWVPVLAQYAAAFGETWVALLHVPGPSAPDGPVYADPRFADHVAFLGRMSAAGFLVAAGSFGDADGAGMTILRLPGAGRLEEATRLATVDDLSVASGFFSVTVRPWNVVLHA